MLYIFIKNGGGTISKNHRGKIVEKLSYTSTTGYISNNITATITGTKLRLAKTTSNSFKSSFDWVYPNMYERWSNKISFKNNTLLANGGIGTGTHSVNTVDTISIAGKIIKDASSTRLVLMIPYNSYADSLTSLVIPNTSFQANDSCEMTVYRNVDTIGIHFRNYTQAVFYDLAYSINPSLNTLPNTGNFAIWNFGAAGILFR